MIDFLLSGALFAQSVGPGYIGRPVTLHKVCLNDTRSGSYLNVRSGPTTSERIVAKLRHGTPISYYERYAGGDGMWWAFIKTPNGNGWVRDDYVCVN